MFAALTAGTLLCGMLTAPVSAAETYQMGDVNMDGVVNIEDAQLILNVYMTFLVGDSDQTEFSDEQVKLATITGITASTLSRKHQIPFSVCDAQVVLRYTVDHLAQLPVPDDVVSYYEQVMKKA